MIRAILVDDEENSVKNLQFLLTKYCPQVQIEAVTTLPEEAITLIQQLKPDVVFLDIEMPRWDGFQVLQKVKNDIQTVIFITAFDQYSLQALKSGALDYILKPIEIEELMIAVQKAVLKVAIQTQKELPQTSKKIKVKDGESVFYLDKEEIVSIEAAESFSWVFMKDQKSYFVSKNLGEFEEELKGDNFFRIHRQYLINLLHIVKYIKGRGGCVEMVNGQNIEVSARRKQQFLALYEQ